MMLFPLNFLDDIYAYALSKTLTKVSSPLTVGLYASCENRINMILKQMQGRFVWPSLSGANDRMLILKTNTTKFSVFCM